MTQTSTQRQPQMSPWITPLGTLIEAAVLVVFFGVLFVTIS